MLMLLQPDVLIVYYQQMSFHIFSSNINLQSKTMTFHLQLLLIKLKETYISFVGKEIDQSKEIFQCP